MSNKFDHCIVLDDETSDVSENAHEKPSAARNHAAIACNGKSADEIMLERVKKHGLKQTLEFETPRRKALCKEGLKRLLKKDSMLIETISLCDENMSSGDRFAVVMEMITSPKDK